MAKLAVGGGAGGEVAAVAGSRGWWRRWRLVAGGVCESGKQLACGRGGCLSWQVAAGGRGGRFRARLQVQIKGQFTKDKGQWVVDGWQVAKMARFELLLQR